jgi:hypothetical protein
VRDKLRFYLSPFNVDEDHYIPFGLRRALFFSPFFFLSDEER